MLLQIADQLQRPNGRAKPSDRQEPNGLQRPSEGETPGGSYTLETISLADLEGISLADLETMPLS